MSDGNESCFDLPNELYYTKFDVIKPDTVNEKCVTIPISRLEKWGMWSDELAARIVDLELEGERLKQMLKEMVNK